MWNIKHRFAPWSSTGIPVPVHAAGIHNVFGDKMKLRERILNSTAKVMKKNSSRPIRLGARNLFS